MKIRWKTLLAWLCGVFGITSCEALEDIVGGGAVMYGMPYADYNVDLKVTDEDGKPIKGIQASEGYAFDESKAVYTDGDGKVEMRLEHNSFCTIHLKDVDGAVNGEYADTVINESSLELKRVKKGDKAWYGGEYNATGTIKMRKK